jgi:hypothetical protein
MSQVDWLSHLLKMITVTDQGTLARDKALAAIDLTVMGEVPCL